MNRADYYNYIDEKLVVLGRRIELRGKLNVLDYHIHSEYFYRDFFNLLYGWSLKNLNDENQNVESIDLCDRTNQIIIQVSATNTKTKIQNSLNKISNEEYDGFSFKFISIAKSAENIKNKTYTVPTEITFDPTKDIYDIEKVLNDIRSLDINKMKSVYDLIWKELGKEVPTIRIESNITTVIKLLSNENLDIDYAIAPIAFDIDKKIEFNQLSSRKALIAQYNIYQDAVNKIYESFDKMGRNKSLFVLNKIHKIYLENASVKKGDELFDSILNDLKNEVANSANCEDLTSDEIDMCADIVVVDAFIRCKIFENPEKQQSC